MNTMRKSSHDRQAPQACTPRRETSSRPSGRWLLGLGLFVLLAASVAYGAWQKHEENGQVLEAAAASRNAAARVRLGDVRASGEVFTLTLPATLKYEKVYFVSFKFCIV